MFVLAVNGLTVHLTHSRFSDGFFTYTKCGIVSGLNFSAIRTNIRTTIRTNTRVIILYSDSSRCTRLTPTTCGTLTKETRFIMTNVPTYVRSLGTMNVSRCMGMGDGILRALGTFGMGLKVG